MYEHLLNNYPIDQYFLEILDSLEKNPQTKIVHDTLEQNYKIGFFENNQLIYGFIITNYPNKIQLQLMMGTDASITLTIEKNANNRNHIAYNHTFQYKIKGYQYKRITRLNTNYQELYRYSTITTLSDTYYESIGVQGDYITRMLEHNQKREYYYAKIEQNLPYPTIPISESEYHQLRKTK